MFSKHRKNPNFRAILGPFCPNLGQKFFFLDKKGSVSIPIIYHCPTNHKKQMSHFWEKYWTDGWTDRQQWFYRILSMTGSYIKVLLIIKVNITITWIYIATPKSSLLN